jgi:hypothetical protein
MKWFEHQVDCAYNKKFRKLEIYYQSKGDEAVFAAMGRVWRLFEIVGKEEEDSGNYNLPPDYGLELLANDLRCSLDYLQEFLGVLAEINFTDQQAWGEGRVYIPKLGERADTYSKRKLRKQTKLAEGSNHVRTLAEEGRTKFAPHSHAHSQNLKPSPSGEGVADPAPPSGDAPPPGDLDPAPVEKNGGSDAGPTRPKFGPANLAQLWNELGCKPAVSELTDERRKKAGLRIRKRGDPGWWRGLFGKVRGLNKPWLTFDFLMRSDTNCLKVLEGNYDHDFGSRDNGGRRQARPGAYQKPNQSNPGKYASHSRIFCTDPGGGGTDPENDSPGQGGVPGASKCPPV